MRNFAYRHNVAKEILSTERVFVKNLKLLVEVRGYFPIYIHLYHLQRFLKPMREAAESGKIPIKHEHIKLIFSDILGLLAKLNSIYF